MGGVREDKEGGGGGELVHFKRLVGIQWRSSLCDLLSSRRPLAARAIPRIPTCQLSDQTASVRQRQRQRDRER